MESRCEVVRITEFIYFNYSVLMNFDIGIVSISDIFVGKEHWNIHICMFDRVFKNALICPIQKIVYEKGRNETCLIPGNHKSSALRKYGKHCEHNSSIQFGSIFVCLALPHMGKKNEMWSASRLINFAEMTLWSMHCSLVRISKRREVIKVTRRQFVIPEKFAGAKKTCWNDCTVSAVRALHELNPTEKAEHSQIIQ